jgi:hypothetical protein
MMDGTRGTEPAVAVASLLLAVRAADGVGCFAGI